MPLSEEIRENPFPHSEMKGQANVLLMPNIDAANITFHTLKVLGDGIVVGPLLLGANKSAHVMTPTITARGIINAAAYACANAGQFDKPVEEKAEKPKKKLW